MHKGPFDSRMEKAEGFLPRAIVKGLSREMRRHPEVRKERCCIPAPYDQTPSDLPGPKNPSQNTQSILSGRAPLKPGLVSVYDDRVSVRRLIIDGL